MHAGHYLGRQIKSKGFDLTNNAAIEDGELHANHATSSFLNNSVAGEKEDLSDIYIRWKTGRDFM